jgi:hypothetical protein
MTRRKPLGKRISPKTDEERAAAKWERRRQTLERFSKERAEEASRR